jgi:hypothetical protein
MISNSFHCSNESSLVSNNLRCPSREVNVLRNESLLNVSSIDLLTIIDGKLGWRRAVFPFNNGHGWWIPGPRISVITKPSLVRKRVNLLLVVWIRGLQRRCGGGKSRDGMEKAIFRPGRTRGKNLSMLTTGLTEYWLRARVQVADNDYYEDEKGSRTW